MFWKENVGIVTRSAYLEDNYLWTLPNCFSYSQGSSEVYRHCVVCSSLFFFFNVKWRLVLTRNRLYRSSHNNYSENVGLFLWKISPTNTFPDVTVKLGLKTGDSEKTIEGELNVYGCFGKRDFQKSSLFYTEEFEYFTDGFLRVFCRFQKKENIDKILQNCENEEGTDREGEEDNIIEDIPESIGVDKLAQDLKNLLLKGLNSDVTLKVKDRQFKAHRNILVVRSPVFASMLQHDTKENATGIVDIHDCSVDSFEVFLSYVYTGKLDIISSDNVFNLHYAADKYQVNDLKFECVKYLKENLSIENFCAVMTLSLQHSESCLQKRATEFFCDNLKTIIKTVQWQEYVKNYPIQANELYIKAVNA